MKWHFIIINLTPVPCPLIYDSDDFEEHSDYTAKMHTTRKCQQLDYMPWTQWVETRTGFYRLTENDHLIKLIRLDNED